MPMREVSFWDFKLKGNDKVCVTMFYHIENNDTETTVRQPIVFDVCEMRFIGGQLHEMLNELEDRLIEAREHMKGDR